MAGCCCAVAIGAIGDVAIGAVGAIEWTGAAETGLWLGAAAAELAAVPLPTTVMFECGQAHLDSAQRVAHLPHHPAPGECAERETARRDHHVACCHSEIHIHLSTFFTDTRGAPPMSALALLLAALFVDSRTFLFTYALVAAPMSRLITLNAVISSASHVPLGDRFAELARGTLHLSLSQERSPRASRAAGEVALNSAGPQGL
jgi:hypothetical protein